MSSIVGTPISSKDWLFSWASIISEIRFTFIVILIGNFSLLFMSWMVSGILLLDFEVGKAEDTIIPANSGLVIGTK